MEKNDILNLLDINAVLYYADYLSLHDIFIPVTDTCKYFIVYGAPVNAAYIAGNTPIYDNTNKYYEQALSELYELQTKVGKDGMMSFLRNLCNVFAIGNINGVQMLNCMLYYEDKRIKRKARQTYTDYMNSIHYVHENGDETITNSKYVEHTGLKPHDDEVQKINRIFERPEDGRGN